MSKYAVEFVTYEKQDCDQIICGNDTFEFSSLEEAKKKFEEAKKHIDNEPNKKIGVCLEEINEDGIITLDEYNKVISEAIDETYDWAIDFVGESANKEETEKYLSLDVNDYVKTKYYDLRKSYQDKIINEVIRLYEED